MELWMQLLSKSRLPWTDREVDHLLMDQEEVHGLMHGRSLAAGVKLKCFLREKIRPGRHNHGIDMFPLY